MKKSVKVNYFYNLVYQIFSLITPLITTPYISRVLGSEGVGQYSFAYSIATYFILIGSLGFGYYGQREIARHQGNTFEQSKLFWEIIIARMFSVVLSLVLYILPIIFGAYGEKYTLLMWILTINVFATAVDVTFLLQGNEEFGVIALRNVLIKCLGIALIFIFVKGKQDVWIYALSQSIVLIVSNVSLWTRVPKTLVKVKISDLNIKRHIIPTLRLFIPTIAVSIYTMLDKTLIGVLVPGNNELGQAISDLENGYYEQSEKIVKMAMTVVTSLGTVMIPHNSQAVASGDKEGFIKNINDALKFVFFLGTPIMFGLSGIAFNFSAWFFGEGYEKVPYLMIMFSPLIMLIGISNVLGLQYLLPLKKDKKYTLSITIGAVVNLILNLALIYAFKSFGACIATIVAELSVTSAMLFFAKKDVHFFRLVLRFWRYLIGGLIMFIVVFVTQMFLNSSVISTLILVAEGVFVYVIFLILSKDETLIDSVKRIKH